MLPSLLWKQRLYAFLLRRLVSPLLDEASLEQLHQLLHVSLQDGKIRLQDVTLNVDYLNRQLSKTASIQGLSIRIRKARVQKLEILLALVERLPEHNSSAEEQETYTHSNSRAGSSSLAWKALKLGIRATSFSSDTSQASSACNKDRSSPTVSLIANVQLDGLVLELETLDGGQENKSNETPNEPASHAIPSVDETSSPSSYPANTNQKGLMALYVEAALESLKLSVQLANVQLRLVTPQQTKSDAPVSSSMVLRQVENWVEVRVKNISYLDMDPSTTADPKLMGGLEASQNDKRPKTVLHKTLDIHRINVLAGETVRNVSLGKTKSEDGPESYSIIEPDIATIALLEGVSQLRLCAVEYPFESSSTRRKVFQDLQVNLGPRLNVSVDERSLVRLKWIVQSLCTRSSTLPSMADEPTSSQNCLVEHVSNDTTLPAPVGGIQEAGTGTAVGDLMEKYEEARRLAEQQQIRGGILLPSDDNLEEDEIITFEAFFDANEHSFGRYSTILKESVVLMNSTELDSADEDEAFVHTRLQLHVPGCGIKVSFWDMTRVNPGQSVATSRRPDEYVLVTISDIHISSSLSITGFDQSLTIGQLDIEDSQIEAADSETEDSLGRRVEIGSILSVRRDQESAGRESDDVLLVHAPCVSVTASKTVSGATDIQVELASTEITYRYRTISNLTKIFAVVSCTGTSATDGGVPGKDLLDHKVSVVASCPSATLSVPVLFERDWSSVYRRCGYELDSSGIQKSSLGILVDNICFEMGSGSDESESSLAFDHMIVYASSPATDRMVSRRSQRWDFLSLSGHSGNGMHTPVSVKVWTNNQGELNHGRRLFPSVPPISSFKARQQDDDEEKIFDKVFSSRLQHLSATQGSSMDRNIETDLVNIAAASERVFEVNVPEIIIDFTPGELQGFSSMLKRVKPPKEGSGLNMVKANDLSTSVTSTVIVCDTLSIALHGEDVQRAERRGEPPVFVSFSSHTSDVKAHILRRGSSLDSLRMLAHEIEAYELFGSNIPGNTSPTCRLASECAVRLRSRVNRPKNIFAARPLFHRSFLFSPISRESPCVALDILHPNNSSLGGSVHLTLYDLTYRYDCSSIWMERLKLLLSSISSQSDQESEDTKPRSDVLRVFLALADCNVDYSSPTKFKTPSRSIIRIEDLRISSNIVWPQPKIQAFRLALGDVSLHLCRTRYPYNFENSRIKSSPLIMDEDEVALNNMGLSDATSENVQKSMGLLTVITLDTLDAVVVMTRPDSIGLGDAAVQVDLTVGELCIFACKDAFKCFLRTAEELSSDLGALDAEGLEALREKSFKLTSEESPLHESDVPDLQFCTLEKLKRQSALRPTTGTGQSATHSDFLLDGYDWTTIDQDSSAEVEIPPGEEQVARWYCNIEAQHSEGKPEEIMFLPAFSATDSSASTSTSTCRGPRIITNHLPLHPVLDPFGDADMDLSKFTGSETTPRIKSRFLVHDLSVKIRCFDGYDWPEALDSEKRKAAGSGTFIIENSVQAPEAESREADAETLVNIQSNDTVIKSLDRRAELLGDLLTGNELASETFKGVPLPEERGAELKSQADRNKIIRRPGKYFQLSASGVNFRIDFLEESQSHRLSSSLNLKVRDFFVAETISSDRPVKLAGEWVNEVDHPRESKDGLFMLKMLTWHPPTRVTPNNEIVNDEAEAVAKILPLRCRLNQRALRFARTFFDMEDPDENRKKDRTPGVYRFPPPLFSSFRFKPLKLKVDYRPERIDTKALRDGAFVELINLSPLDGMILTLQQVQLDYIEGFGSVLSLTIRRWIEDICATQMFKFLTNARPFEPLSHVGGSAADLIVLPWEAVKNGESIRAALRTGASSFSTALLYETVNVSSRATHFLADQVARASMGGTSGNNVLPSRPMGVPRGVLDTTPHVVESISRGLQAANYKLVIIPYREYRRSGARGAATSVLKGIPVALAAPTSATAEAISFALLGARNSIRPDIRKEEEASLQGLHHDSGKK